MLKIFDIFCVSTFSEKWSASDYEIKNIVSDFKLIVHNTN